MSTLVDRRRAQAGSGGAYLVARESAAAGRCGPGTTTVTGAAESR